MNESQREPRTIREALADSSRGETTEISYPFNDEDRKQMRQLADQERKDEQYLDESRGLWGPTE
jgi:hypothetical protein